MAAGVRRAFTLEYAAPEVIGRSGIGPESDIFELGMMLYEMLTGERPASALDRLLSDAWKPVALGEPWGPLIDAALRIKSEERPKSVIEWWQKFVESGGSDAATRRFTNSAGIEMVYIPPGSFQMGSENGDSDEKPVHKVTISNGFYIGRYQVTQGQWQRVMGTSLRQQGDKAHPSQGIFGEGDSYPMYYVSWNEAQAFCRKLNEIEAGNGLVYRPPTEAEWEYACRAGTTGDYAGNLDDMAWYRSNSGVTAHPVGQKQANAFGIYDMHGNVWEWCQDWYHPNYDGAPTDGSAWLSGGEQKFRVLRGGSWYGLATDLRSANRKSYTPRYHDSANGFRLAAVR